MQPLIENAINHGLIPKEKDGHLRLEFIQEYDKSIRCIIDDNGQGRQLAGEETKEDDRTSHGSRLINELINAFNKYEEIGIEIAYLDKTPPIDRHTYNNHHKTPHEQSPV